MAVLRVVLGPWGKRVALVTDNIVMEDNVPTGAISLLSISGMIFIRTIVLRAKLLIVKTFHFWSCRFLLDFLEHEARVDIFGRK